jgi:hypothetical protein
VTSHAAPDDRAQLINGLRDLAAFLESRPDVPAPADMTAYFFPPDGSDAERRTEIDAIASRIYTQAYRTMGGHYVTSRFFGPVEYRAVSIPRETARSTKGNEQE